MKTREIGLVVDLGEIQREFGFEMPEGSLDGHSFGDNDLTLIMVETFINILIEQDEFSESLVQKIEKRLVGIEGIEYVNLEA